MFQTSSSIYHFGDGKTFKATKNTQIPAEIGSHNVLIETDVINSDISLLLSQASMKRADMNLNFKDVTASVFGKNIELVVTKSGHYAVQLTVPCQIIHSQNANVNVTLTVQANLDKEKMAQKLHRQFAHASSEKLLRLVNCAGSTWSQDSKLKEKIKLICKNCPVCLIYKKHPHDQLLAYHLLQNLRNVSLSTSNFTKERFCYILKTRSDCECHHEVLGCCI